MTDKEIAEGIAVCYAGNCDVCKYRDIASGCDFIRKYAEKLFKTIKDGGVLENIVTYGTTYNPDDLLGPESMDLASFVENVCMENCRMRIFFGDEGPAYEILN